MIGYANTLPRESRPYYQSKMLPNCEAVATYQQKEEHTSSIDKNVQVETYKLYDRLKNS